MREQVLFVVRLGDEIIRPALQAVKDILGVGQRSEQNHRNVLPDFGRFYLSAQFVTVHFRHDDVADDE